MDDRVPVEREAVVEVVALISSAGGVDALTVVLRDLPVHLPAAVVVQHHLGGQGSALLHILQRRVDLPVAWATDQARLVPGQVMVCPPLKRFEVFPDGTCAVLPAPAGAREFPHDALLRSLGDAFGSRAVAVVLTGMGKDGAAGTTALKAAGGIVIAQSEDTAEHPSMPRAAAEAGADLVLPLHEIGTVVGDVVRGGPLPRPHAETDAVQEVFGGHSVMEGIARGIDWSGTPLGPVSTWGPSLRTMVRLVMAAPQPLILLWGEQRVMLYNDANIEYSGGKHPEHFARPSLEMWPETRPVLVPIYDRVMHGESVHMRDSRWVLERRARPEEAWFDVSYTPVRDEHGDIVGILQSSNERTIEVLAARRLQILNQLASTPAGQSRRQALEGALAVVDNAADIPFAVAYLLDASGTRASLVGAVGVEEGRALAPRELRLAPGSAWPLHQAVRQKSPLLIDDVATRFRGHLVGSERLAAEYAVLHPLRDEAEDKIVGVLVLGAHPRLPLDDRYREFLTLAGDTIAAHVAESHARQRERQRLERLAELDRAKMEFFSNVSHEFRTPLTLMLGPLEELLRHPGDQIPARRADVELVERNARRLLRLVGTLLDFSQAEAGRLRPRFAPTDLARLTGEVASMFRSAAEVAGLTLTIDAPPLPEPVWVDAEMWEKIVSNLLSNALKFTWKGAVDVVLRALPHHAELVVRDTGVGIPSDELPFVFQRFHRVREARGRTHEGAGIGLALVHELVRSHHGRIRVSSEEGKGTAFTVWIPRGERLPAAHTGVAPESSGRLAAAMADEAARWDAAREDRQLTLNLDGAAWTGEPLPPRAPGARILVVDDNPDMRDYLVRLLSTTWHVTEARDGNEALEQALREPPDLVLADVMMPGTDGFTLLQQIRADDALSQLPVILVTARAGEESAIEGLLAGADDYIVKPFSARELLARVGAQLELSQIRRASEERLRRVLETETVGVLYFDHSGTVIDANEVFLRMSGYTRAEIERGELTWRRMTPPEWIAVSEQQLDRLATTGGIGPYEKEYFLADGTRRWMLFAGRDLGDGTISEFCIDITDLKNAENAKSQQR